MSSGAPSSRAPLAVPWPANLEDAEEEGSLAEVFDSTAVLKGAPSAALQWRVPSVEVPCVNRRAGEDGSLGGFLWVAWREDS